MNILIIRLVSVLNFFGSIITILKACVETNESWVPGRVWFWGVQLMKKLPVR